jgi:glycosyltransferase involved in cell wall biosynthesis
MIVVHVVECWIGGVGNYVKELANKFVNNENEIHLIVGKSLDCADFDGLNEKIKIHQINMSRNVLGCISAAIGVKRLIKKINPNVIHAHSTFAGIYTRLNGFKNVVYTPHCWSFLKVDIGFIQLFFYVAIEKILSTKTNKIICISNEELRAAKKYKIGNGKVKLVRTGISDLDLTLNKLQYRIDECVNIGFFGRLDNQKGFDIIQAACPYFPNNVRVHVFGRPIRGGVSINYDLNLLHHGWIDSKNINKAMAEMDVILIPSRWEGFALVPIEAMRASKPIIASPIGSLMEQVIDGYNGVIMNDLNPMSLVEAIEVVSKSNNLLRMGGNGRNLFESIYGIDDLVGKHYFVYGGCK